MLCRATELMVHVVMLGAGCAQNEGFRLKMGGFVHRFVKYPKLEETHKDHRVQFRVNNQIWERAQGRALVYPKLLHPGGKSCFSCSGGTAQQCF